MAYPDPYERQYDYQSYQNLNPTRPLPADKVNADLNAVAEFADEIVDFLQGFVREDGELANGSVGYDQLSAALQTNGIAPATAWATATEYTVGDAVMEDGSLYRCEVAHTSAVFADDLTAEYWVFVATLPVPPPSTTTLGGVYSAAAQSHKFLASIGTDGTPTLARPDFSDLTIVDAAAARDAMGLEIGADVQGYDADLAAIALLSTTTFGRSLLTAASAAALNVTTLGNRTRLAVDTTFYVRTAGAANPGSNSNTGLTNDAAGAWLTINYAIRWIYANVDANGKKIVVQVADDATITEAITLYPVVGIDPGGWSTSQLVLRGNTTTLGNVKITTTSNNCVQAVATFVGWRVEGFEFSTITSGACVLADFGSIIYLGKNKFGACAGIHIQALYNSKVEIVDDWTASGSAALHWYAESGGQILVVGGKTLTFSGSPVWSSAFVYAAKAATVTATGMLFSGTATGPRFLGDHTGSFGTGGTALDTFFASAGGSAGSITPAPVAFGGTGVTTAAAEQARLGQTSIGFKIASVNFNSAGTDNAIAITLPSGFTRYRVVNCILSHASGALTTATCGLFTAAAAGGTAIVASGTAITVSTASESTNNNTQNFTLVNSGTMSFTETTLYFRVQTPQGSAATGDVIVVVLPVS